MQIKIKNVAVENKGKYKVVHVNAVDIYKEKEIQKDVVSFGESEGVFTVLAQAKEGEVFDITAKQNGKYWNWVDIATATSVSQSLTTNTKSFPAPNRGNYETPEERAARQVYIVRQSSITAALNLLTLNGVKKATEADVLKSARIFENFVFGRTETVSAFAAIEQMEDDIPL